ncbi:MAG: hypothetical protein WCA90_12135 [Ilumatobacteraceae bacterium]
MSRQTSPASLSTSTLPATSRRFGDGERIGVGRQVGFTFDPDGFTNVQEVPGAYTQTGRELAVCRFSGDVLEVCKAGPVERWIAQVVADARPRRVTAMTEAAAKKELRLLLRSIDDGKPVTDGNLTLGALLTEWDSEVLAAASGTPLEALWTTMPATVSRSARCGRAKRISCSARPPGPPDAAAARSPPDPTDRRRRDRPR